MEEEIKDTDTQVENTAEENVEQELSSIEQQPKQEESDKEKNFKALREAKYKLEFERNELLKKLSQYESASKPEEPEDDEINLAPDDFAEGKHLTKVGRKIKKLEEALAKQQQESHISSTEAMLKAKYSDIDKIVSKDNIDKLKSLYPEVAQSIYNNPDIYSKAVSAYTLIKKFGIDSSQNFDQEKSVVESNNSKPRPITSINKQEGNSPLHNANLFAGGLTDDVKKQLYKEMLEARKSY